MLGLGLGLGLGLAKQVSPTSLVDDFIIDFNMSDTASMTDDGGGLISLINSSVGAYTMSAATTERATSGTRTIQGLNALDFDGVANNYQTNVFLPSLPVHTVMVLLEMDTHAVSQAIYDNDDGSKGCQTHHGVSNIDARVYTPDKAGHTASGAHSVPVGTAKVITVTIDTSFIRVYENDVELGSASTGDVIRHSFIDCIIGANDQRSSFFFNGKLARFLVYDRVLSHAEITQSSNHLNSPNWGN